MCYLSLSVKNGKVCRQLSDQMNDEINDAMAIFCFLLFHLPWILFIISLTSTAPPAEAPFYLKLCSSNFHLSQLLALVYDCRLIESLTSKEATFFMYVICLNIKFEEPSIQPFLNILSECSGKVLKPGFWIKIKHKNLHYLCLFYFWG